MSADDLWPSALTAHSSCGSDDVAVRTDTSGNARLRLQVEQCFGLVSSARHMLEVEMTENAKSLLSVAVLSLTELIEELRDVQLPAIGAPSAAAEVGSLPIPNG